MPHDTENQRETNSDQHTTFRGTSPGFEPISGHHGVQVPTTDRLLPCKRGVRSKTSGKGTEISDLLIIRLNLIIDGIS